MLKRLYSALSPGGCIIVVDKIEQNGYFATVMHRLTLAGKVATGVPTDQIIAKELSLSGIQRPLRLVELADYAPKEFFRFGEFVGFLIEK